MLEYRTDPDLLRVERETYLRFSDYEKKARVHTDNPHMAHRLIEHPEFEETRRYGDDEVVHGIEGLLPVGCILIKGSPRSSGGQADVVTSEVLRDDEEAEA